MNHIIEKNLCASQNLLLLDFFINKIAPKIIIRINLFNQTGKKIKCLYLGISQEIPSPPIAAGIIKILIPTIK